jgi:hypothetical protein
MRIKVTKKRPLKSADSMGLVMQEAEPMDASLIKGIGQCTNDQKRLVDFSDLVGRWTPDETFDEILASQRLVFSKDWS